MKCVKTFQLTDLDVKLHFKEHFSHMASYNSNAKTAIIRAGR